MNCLQTIRKKLKLITDLYRHEFDFNVENETIDLFLKSEYKDLSKLNHIKIDEDTLIIDLSDVSDKKINLYLDNPIISDENRKYKISNIKILSDNISLNLGNYIGINCDNLYVKSNSKVTLGSIDAKDDVTIIADEIDSEITLHINSNSQNYRAKKISMRNGFLDADKTINMNTKELQFFNSGVSAKEMIINSDNVSFSILRNFELDNLVINSNTIIGNNSNISARSTNITANNCECLNIISNPAISKNKVKVKV